MYACKKNKADIVKMLIKLFKVNINQIDELEKTGFIIACSNNSLEVVRTLIERYPDIIN